MEMKRMRVRITFTEELLGTASGNKDLHAEYIAGKAPTIEKAVEEVESVSVSVEEEIEKGMTIFPKNADGKPIIYDYQVRGFFKEACSMLKKVSDSKSKDLKAFKKEIDGLIFVEPRQIVLNGELGDICQRPLRAQTPKGERVALSSSETIKAGATAEFEVICMVESDMELVKEWLDYGAWHGLGQWRSSGKGKFTWEEI